MWLLFWLSLPCLQLILTLAVAAQASIIPVHCLGGQAYTYLSLINTDHCKRKEFIGFDSDNDFCGFTCEASSAPTCFQNFCSKCILSILWDWYSSKGHGKLPQNIASYGAVPLF